MKCNIESDKKLPEVYFQAINLLDKVENKMKKSVNMLNQVKHVKIHKLFKEL